MEVAETSPATPLPDGAQTPNVEVEIEEDDRETWGNKIEFVLSTIGFSVGLAGVWRFPYICQKNGGGAFLIPYAVSYIVLGIPLFFLEMAIGQRFRKGSIGVWNQISPIFGGVGVTSFMVSGYVSIYYNMVLSWCFYYLFVSFQKTLPYQDCPTDTTSAQECAMAGKTSYYWYRVVLNASESIEETGDLQWRLCLVLLFSWLLLFFATIKGVKSSGKVAYFTGTFPFIVMTIFFVRGITLDGASNGIKRLFTPQFDKITNLHVWFDAATQVLFALGLGFGGLIAISSYTPLHNNCKRYAIFVPVVSCVSSIIASVVVFSVLGFKATGNYNDCLNAAHDKTNTSACKSLDEYLSDVGQGPGLTFIAFTEAITNMPAPQLWAILLFLMLITFGAGNELGTFGGVRTPLVDLLMFTPLKNELITGITCAIFYLVGLVFCLNTGEYWIQLFNDHSVATALLVVAFLELIIVNYVYGTNKFLDDIEFMIGNRPGWYWIIMWKFVGPPLAFLLVVASFVEMGKKGMSYSKWDKSLGQAIVNVSYPTWGVIVIVLIILSSIIWIPLIAVFRYCKRLLKPKKQAVEIKGMSNVSTNFEDPEQ